MTLEKFNQSNSQYDLLKTTCGAENWVNAVLSKAPFDSKDQLIEIARKCWYQTTESDWLEAFLYHPEIGDMDSLREKFSRGKVISKSEQSGVDEAEESVLIDLSTQNKAYKDIFGFIFIVFATGKSAKQMLDLLNARINNTKAQEMKIAMEEQWKITKLRLNNLITA